MQTPYWLDPVVRWRFFRRVDLSSDDLDVCAPWIGPPDPSTGYGQVNWVDVGGKMRAHVLAWELENHQQVPVDPATGRKLDVDHTCHNEDASCPGGKTCAHRLCCNGRHLVVKTTRQNKEAADEPRKRGQFRETFDCGHPTSEENTYLITRKGMRNGKPRPPERRCKICTRQQQNAR